MLNVDKSVNNSMHTNFCQINAEVCFTLKVRYRLIYIYVVYLQYHKIIYLNYNNLQEYLTLNIFCSWKLILTKYKPRSDSKKLPFVGLPKNKCTLFLYNVNQKIKIKICPANVKSNTKKLHTALIILLL